MKPTVRIFNNGETLSHAAAEMFVALGAEAVAARGRFLVALNGGGTPKRLFELLATDYREKLDWSKTHVFWGDERCVPPDDPENSYGMARGLLLGRVPIPAENIHRVLSERGPGEASADYIHTLKQFASPPLMWPRFDLVLLGMGDDGHTASLFPGSPVDEAAPAVAVTAHYQGRPAQRVTLTPLVFNSARAVVFMVTGTNKADTLSSVLSGTLSLEKFPAQRVRPSEGTVTWLVDEAAGSKLTPNPSPTGKGPQ